MLKHAVFIADGDRHAIHLWLDHTVDLLASEAFLQPNKKGRQLLLRVGVVQAHHRHRVPDLREALDRRTADALRGGIFGQQVGVFRLNVLKLAQKHVELLVGDDRHRLHIVEAVVAVEFGTEKFGASSGFSVSHDIFIAMKPSGGTQN